jgi:hypothetical protein
MEPLFAVMRADNDGDNIHLCAHVGGRWRHADRHGDGVELGRCGRARNKRSDSEGDRELNDDAGGCRRSV